VCPQSILHIDPKTRKAYNIETDMCWECYPCVKACPQNAIEIRGYSDFVPMGARAICNRDTKSNIITWTIHYRDGRRLSFTYPIRTNSWDSIKPPHELPLPQQQDLKNSLLLREPDIFGFKEILVPKKQ
jgi:adenylylsulfate reductase subunit B